MEHTIDLLKYITYQTIQLILAFGLLLALSVFIYGSFYFAFVPAPIHSGPVHLIFKPCDSKMGACGFLNASLTLSERNPILMTGQLYTLTLRLESSASDKFCYYQRGIFL